MKTIFKSAFLLAAACFVCVSCGKDDDGDIQPEGGGGKPSTGAATEFTPFEQLNQGISPVNSHAAADVLSHSSLKLNYRSFIALGTTELGSAVTDPIYPRIKRMKNGNYILFVNQSQHGGSCYYAISNNLKLWEPKGPIFKSEPITDMYGNSNTRLFATTDAVVLANGDILAVASYRANTGGYTKMHKDAGLMLRRSTNNGQTWSDPVAIYQGVNWEPFLIQLSNGEIHCYFTDSSRTWDVGKDTGTVLLISTDNGVTWSPSFGSSPYYVIRQSYRTQNSEGKVITCYNDQMPSVIQLNETGELAAAMETARPAPSSAYDISFAYSGEGSTFPHIQPDEVGPADRRDKAFSGAAPYLGQFRSGETVLSYSGVNLKMGNAKARNFPSSNTNDYNPFDGLGSGGYWGGTHVADAHHILVALHNSEKQMRVAQVVLNHRITATQRTVTVDGNNSEWAATDEALFVGAKSQAQATLRCSADADEIYFLVEALDEDVTDGDHITLYLAPTDTKLTANRSYSLKVSSLLSPDITVTPSVYDGSKWTETSNLDAVVKTKIDNKKNDKGGYRVEISIPRSKLTIKSGEILINLALKNLDTGGSATEDQIASTTDLAKWIPVNGL